MNPSKIEEDLFHHLGPPPGHHDQFMDPRHAQSQPSIDDDAFSLAEIDLFRDDEDDDGRLATPEEIRGATPPPLLSSWRSVWKDRNEDTAYLTAWKRIQDKLTVHVSESAACITGNNSHFLCFKNNSSQYVSHVDQWQDIVMSFHSDADFKHLGLKETIERIKQVWTVGAKFYGIPESYIRTCVAACPVCSDESSGCAPRSKRRRFEYTESFDVPAKEVPVKLQQLAAKHKVVLCIRQKYIRYKPFMAEVKDYACHRAGHEPGPLDGNARIMHRMVGHKGGFLMDHETVYGMAEDGENEGFGFLGKDSGDLQHSVLQQVQELRNELGLLEDDGSKSVGLLTEKQHMDDVLVVEHDLPDWVDDHHTRIYGDGKDPDGIEDDEASFGRTLGEVASWDQMRTECRNEKDLLGETCKEEKWLKCGEFDQKGILGCSNPKLIKPLRHDEAIDPDIGLAGIHVDSFYPENPKWFDSPCGLDPGADCGDVPPSALFGVCAVLLDVILFVEMHLIAYHVVPEDAGCGNLLLPGLHIITGIKTDLTESDGDGDEQALELFSIGNVSDEMIALCSNSICLS
ncbi:hypothetical protein DH2020_023226 [Rehmannia glutinosa]|uniref:Integrase zinc-binding domain-containing protein n=1 Tax=Rehmannia glutinosa TaxID=99300 RepID=A0ABR0W7S5_REHGL